MPFGGLLSSPQTELWQRFQTSSRPLEQQWMNGTDAADRPMGCSGPVPGATLFVVLLGLLQVFLADCREQGVGSAGLFSWKIRLACVLPIPAVQALQRAPGSPPPQEGRVRGQGLRRRHPAPQEAPLMHTVPSPQGRWAGAQGGKGGSSSPYRPSF